MNRVCTTHLQAPDWDCEVCSGEYMTGMLTFAQNERLTYLVQECAEVIHIATKTMLFGFNAIGRDGTVHNNRRMLENEIGNMVNALRMMCEAGDVSDNRILEAELAKAKDIIQYLQHQPVNESCKQT